MEGVSGSTANEALVQQTVQRQAPPAPAPAPQPQAAEKPAEVSGPRPEGNKGLNIDVYA